jgi:hypothetical protein
LQTIYAYSQKDCKTCCSTWTHYSDSEPISLYSFSLMLRGLRRSNTNNSCIVFGLTRSWLIITLKINFFSPGNMLNWRILCCQFLWIVHFWLPLQYYLTFIWWKKNISYSVTTSTWTLFGRKYKLYYYGIYN